ncbi:MAG: N-acetylmuramoyl-L-alanine amidase [Eubacteriales bacterium]|nr:N-acetylmuramoyl-L-alanine amidase [Eubacteriales bacterium]
MMLLRQFVYRRDRIAFAIGVMICAAATIYAVTDAIWLNSDMVPVFSSDDTVLVIDAGHGGIDGGAIGVDGSKESDINLAIAKKLFAASVFAGKRAIMTRVDDRSQTENDQYSEHSELKYRADLANSTKNPVLVSIHQNYYPTAQPGGAQVIYSANGRSERLGGIFQTNIVNSLESDNRHLAQKDNNRLYVLENVSCPAVLVECGFVSNHFDIGKLTDSSYQTALAAVMLASYIQFSAEKADI